MAFKDFLLAYMAYPIWIVSLIVGFSFMAAFRDNSALAVYGGGAIIVGGGIWGKYLQHRFKARSGQILWHGRH